MDLLMVGARLLGIWCGLSLLTASPLFLRGAVRLWREAHLPPLATMDQPAPGSDAALIRGCTCPVVENHHGNGTLFPSRDAIGFWIVKSCPLHASEVER